jgi:hypothetical protein
MLRIENTTLWTEEELNDDFELSSSGDLFYANSSISNATATHGNVERRTTLNLPYTVRKFC